VLSKLSTIDGKIPTPWLYLQVLLSRTPCRKCDVSDVTVPFTPSPLRHSSLYHEYEMTYGESIGHVTDDVTIP